MIEPYCDLTGKSAVVTGASGGIGRAIALEFARAGADLAIHCRSDRKAAESVAGEVSQLGRQAEICQADFSRDEQIDGFIQQVHEFFPRVDVWVNNAGVDVLTGSAAKWSYGEKLGALLNVDVRGSLLLARAAGQRMAAGQGGVILNIGWDQAATGMEGDSGELFAASKNAIMGFTRSLALSLAPKVRVNCIAPGWIRTDWGRQAGDYWQQRVIRETPAARWGTPEDIAAAARFLASDEASYITGQVINVNGGAVR